MLGNEGQKGKRLRLTREGELKSGEGVGERRTEGERLRLPREGEGRRG